MRLALLLVMVITLGGCALEPAAQTGPLPRPVVVIGGFWDPGVGHAHVAEALRERTGDERISSIGPGMTWSMDSARREVVETVEAYYPDDNPDETAEVDVVAISMGGLVARYAALPPEDENIPRLNVRRMYTISTPHQGARLANLFGWFGTAAQMRPGSPFLAELEAREKQLPPEMQYEVVGYTRSFDEVVGTWNTLPPPGAEYVFLKTPFPWPGHLGVTHDGRLHDLIARRLQNKP